MPEPTPEGLFRLAELAGFVFRGKVTRTGAAGPASAQSHQPTPTVTVRVEEVLRSTDVLRGLAGRDVTLVGKDVDSLEDQGAYIFFTDVAALSDHAVLRYIGHVRATRETGHELAAVLTNLAERPLRERVASAELIIEGHVTESRKADPDAVQKSEHDPDWWIARVAVESVVKGTPPPENVDVLFANSRDIAWFKSPKLHKGVRGILLLHSARDVEVPRTSAKRRLYQAADPLDFQPPERMNEIKRIAAAVNPEEGVR
jgi:hypothetical protein